MKNTFFLLLFLISFSSFSQIQGEDEVYLTGDRIEPKFNGGGLDKFYEYVNKNFDFSKVTKPGRMITSFTINEFGEIKNIKVIQFLDVESASEIIRVLRNCPKWEPALRGGKSISVEIKFPLDFKFSKK
ncbi:energy transducer TonB [Flavobacterium sp. SUN052]|uniref:energy transducer TonB n=1 Tax=Flavobacterium sp. SUN052 TaxID=3002441 RepID=UPI00237E7DAB|nr:energy transducer TonB [Flavobacterium sp. SUN052]MEC4005908.1 energy transducer TonB [Flavobacterium sp. SUN052]